MSNSLLGVKKDEMSARLNYSVYIPNNSSYITW